MKILDIKTLGQRDSRWSGQRLGTVNGITIGSHGCVITCHSMLATYYGKPTLPNQLDDFLTNNGLYAQGNLWIPANVARWNSNETYNGTDYCETSPAPMDKIRQAIDAGLPPTLWVINGGVRHNVLAVGYTDDNQIIVNDPWIGDQVNMKNRWGDSKQVILSVDYYRGTPAVSVQTVAVPKADFEGMVYKSTQHDKTSKNWGFDDPRNTSAEQIDEKIQRSINGYKGQVSNANAERDDARTKLATAQNEVKNRIEQLGRLTDQLTEEQALRKELTDTITSDAEKLRKLTEQYEGRLTVLQGQVDDASKDKGKALNDLATVKSQLDVCKAGGTVKTESLWDSIIKFLKGTKVVK